MPRVERNLWRARMRAILRRWPLGLPPGVARRLRRYGYRAPLGSVRLGNLRHVEPVSRVYGFDRGQPIDRYYIAKFLAGHSALVHGRVLEVGGREYTDEYGGGKVSRSDILNVTAGDPRTTFVADLTDGASVPDASFDCVILTQTLHLIFDLPAAIATIHRILKPGGALLLTVPGTISQIEEGVWRSVWYWGFTRLSLERLFASAFPRRNLAIFEYGNVLASIAFLEGLVAEEFSPAELEHRDELYPLVLGLRATKPS